MVLISKAEKKSHLDWSKIIQIERSWTTDILNNHFTEVNGKITVCLHTVSTSGTQILPDNLVKKLHQIIPEFVIGKRRTNEMNNPMDISFEVSKYFGDTDPKSEGKYGELLLFALVESLLGCKMVAHKIRALSNMNDQVKGGDGIFLGEYLACDETLQPAYLIGESKVVTDFNYGLPDAFKSIYRFHDPANSSMFREVEMLVAKDNLIIEDDVDLDELYKRLDPKTEDYKHQILVHPILIMYDSGKVRACEKASSTKTDLEKKLSEELNSIKDGLIKAINTQLTKYVEIQSVYLHFFLIPYNDVNAFRNAMYSRIHNGAIYRPKNDKKVETKL